MLKKYIKYYNKIFIILLISEFILLPIISYYVVYIVIFLQALPTLYIVSSSTYLINRNREKYKEISRRYTIFGIIYCLLFAILFLSAIYLKEQFGMKGFIKY
jgi:hypothetical protein